MDDTAIPHPTILVLFGQVHATGPGSPAGSIARSHVAPHRPPLTAVRRLAIFEKSG